MFLQNSCKVAADDNEPEKINAQLQLISAWLEENPNINAYKNLDNLLFFLRSCKYDVERTKKKLKTFYLMRAERIEWFANRDPLLPELQELLSIGVFLPVDGADELGRKVVIIRTAAHDPKLHTQNNVFKVSKMILDLILKFEPEHCARGIVAIFDMQGVQLGHALQLNPRLIKHSVESWQAYPCQPKLLEFINTPMHVNIFLNTFRVFMTSKMRARLFVRKQSRPQLVQCKQLPKDIGGSGCSYNELALKWKYLVEQNAAYFVEQDQYKTILNK